MLTRRNERRRPTVGRHPRRGAWIRTRISGSLERYTRLELVYADWQSAVLATGRIPRTYGAEYGSPTRLTGLEDQHLSDRPTPQRHTYPVVKELTTQLVGTVGFEPASPCFRSSQDKPDSFTSRCSKWSGCSDSNRDRPAPKADGLAATQHPVNPSIQKQKAPNPLGIGAFWKANDSNRLTSPGARLD